MTFDNLDDAMLAPNPISQAKIVGDGVPCETYLSQPDGVKRGDPRYVMNGADLMEFALCPHRWVNGYSDEGSSATEWGSLLDCLLMDKAALAERFLVLPETYVNDDGEEKPWNFNAKVCKAWRLEKNPKGTRTEIKHEVFWSAKDAAELILADPQLAELFESSRKQVMLTGVYEDKETGVRVPVKALLDLVPPADFLADLKSCNSAHPRAWRKHVFNYNYHVQAARHLDLWNAASGEQRNEFRHILQESIHPFEVAKRFLSQEFIALGRQRYIGALKRYAKCLSTNDWPGYDTPESSADMLIDGWLMCAPEAWMIGQ